MAVLLAMLLAQAATETYDLATFEVPEGKRIERKDDVSFSDAGPKTFCQYMVCRQIASAGDAAKDFEAEWASLVAKPYTVKAERKSGTSEWPGNWTLTLGAAPVSAQGVPDFVSILAVFTGHGVRVAVVMNYNDESLKPKL